MPSKRWATELEAEGHTNNRDQNLTSQPMEQLSKVVYLNVSEAGCSAASKPIVLAYFGLETAIAVAPSEATHQ